ncbi:ROK family transcriptional regulator [Aquibacillus salsiterrae]|uniref:ROK family transcriptional regulator n=1 Tax=Aquibacillus salsiterrae TaxID=2950439 RepID=A0A9X4AFB2_9BACI|nr:ROK family protein [Aquibacillus salsiterrae]MDC3416065.1 ROK family transcriptional regulator [Aquibacillus salsiterrae]
MNQTWNQHVVKKENKTLVLEVIKVKSPISRADIAQVTGLNKGTVSSLVSELIDEQLIYESGPGQSSGGRRPVMLLFNQNAGYSIGLDLGVNYLLGVLTDLNGNIIYETKVSINDFSYPSVLKQLIKSIEYLMSSTPESPYGIIGIGIGVPGIVSNEGSILLAPNLGWENIDLKTVIEETFGLPVIIENEANAGAYGEKMFGAGKDFSNIIYISVGIGIGVGLILNDSLYKGNNGFSGELGHMTIEINGLKCRCGNRGCWELYASEQALIKRAEELELVSSDQTISLDLLNELAENGHMETIQLLSGIGDFLGVGINNIINTFNPQQIIIGNRLATSEKWIKSSLDDRVNNYALRFNRDELEIKFSELTTHSTSLGVAAFIIENFFKSDLVTNP